MVNQRRKTPIDLLREGGGVFQLGEPGDVIVEMLVLENRLLGVTQRAVYAANFADHVDPERTDINIPNIISQKLLAYGAEANFISETLLTGAELFNETYLGGKFNAKRALEIAWEAAQNLGSMMDIRTGFEQDQTTAIERLRSTRIGKSIELPRMAVT